MYIHYTCIIYLYNLYNLYNVYCIRFYAHSLKGKLAGVYVVKTDLNSREISNNRLLLFLHMPALGGDLLEM